MIEIRLLAILAAMAMAGCASQAPLKAATGDAATSAASPSANSEERNLFGNYRPRFQFGFGIVGGSRGLSRANYGIGIGIR